MKVKKLFTSSFLQTLFIICISCCLWLACASPFEQRTVMYCSITGYGRSDILPSLRGCAEVQYPKGYEVKGDIDLEREICSYFWGLVPSSNLVGPKNSLEHCFGNSASEYTHKCDNVVQKDPAIVNVYSARHGDNLKGTWYGGTDERRLKEGHCDGITPTPPYPPDIRFKLPTGGTWSSN